MMMMMMMMMMMIIIIIIIIFINYNWAVTRWQYTTKFAGRIKQ